MNYKNINITNLNLKEFQIYQTYNYNLTLFHAEIVRIYQVLKTANSKHLAKKIQLLLFMIDAQNKTKTDINGNIFRGDIEKVALPCIKYMKRKKSRKNLEKRMEEYYNEK